jgi:hypothetical protein
MTYRCWDRRQAERNQSPVRSHGTIRWMAVACSSTIAVVLIFFMSADRGADNSQDRDATTSGQADTASKVPQGESVMREVVAPSGTK